ncbi:hypothetical protein [Halorussus halobius]|uniref:hypothetical protein n=1 Tax=Halorussus halobius TaxID=1710537 RepID=UPI001092179F|nr:hypothetical protein [Halorussus halobius]
MSETLDLAPDPEQAVEQLAVEASGGPDLADDLLIPERIYTEPMREFVYQVVRDLVELKRETDLTQGPLPLPDGPFFAALRDEYGLGPGSDLRVIAQLGHAVADRRISRIDHFIATVFIFPFSFRHSARQEEFAEHLCAGREDLAARLMIQTTYDLFEMPEEDFEQSLRRGISA